MANTIASIVIATAEAARRAVRVSVIARVTAYDAASQTCSAIPVVREVQLVDGEWVAVPSVEITGIPVLWPGGGLRGFTCGLDADDEVALLVRTQSHDEVDADATADGDDEAYTPQLRRRLDLSDSLADPGYFRPGAGRDAGTYNVDGEPVLYYPGGEQLRCGDSTAAEALALASAVNDRLATLRSKINALIGLYETHTHVETGATTNATLPSFVPPILAALNDVACDDVLVRS